jgi:tetratricopeptide (TPR) repeat protein
MSDLTLDAKSADIAGRRAAVREGRVRLFLLAAFLLLVTPLAFLLPVPASLALKKPPTPAEHARQMQKDEVARRFEQGVVMLHAKDYQHALTAFHRVLEIDPNMPEAYVNAGYALLGMGDAKAAADFFDSATVLRPNQLNAYFGLGEALAALGDKLGALQAMETYLHRAPADDRFRQKAEAAVWELRAEVAKERPQLPGGALRPFESSAGVGKGRP